MKSKPQPKKRASGGGAATTAGTTFQEDVACYFAAMVLAERGVPAPLSLPSDITLEDVAVETDQPVDDILVGTSGGGLVFVQCKSSLQLSRSSTSELAKCARQVVEQYRAGCRPRGASSRALDPALDRLVLALGPRTSVTLVTNLGSGLEALRTAGQGAADAVLNRQSVAVQRAIAILKSHCDNAWRSVTGRSMPKDEWSCLARLLHVWQLDLSATGAQRGLMDQALRAHVLSRPRDAARALRAITGIIRMLGPRRSSIDRRQMQEALLAERISLRTPLGYTDSIAALKLHTKARLGALQRLSEIEFGETPLKVRRPAVDAIREMAATGHVLVVGEPGAGKSGCMHAVASGAMSNGCDLVLIAADVTNTESLASLSADLGLADRQLLPQVLANWAGAELGYLVIDALDAARNRDSLPTLRNLVEQVRVLAPRWRVVASMREFDLQHSPQVQELFSGVGHAEHTSPTFREVRHVYVRRLSDDELTQAKEQCPPLAGVLSRTTAALTDLVRNPFNLKLLVELIGEHLDESRLASVRIQVQLLDLYWERRIEQHDPERSREHTAAALVTAMRERRALFVDERDAVQTNGFVAAAMRGLQEQGVVRAEDDGVVRGSSRRISFAHNILFDYAAARLWLQDLPDSVLDPLAMAQNEDLLLFARPSLVFAFERLWYAPDAANSDERPLFWSRAIGLARREHMRLIGRVAAAGVAAAELQRLREAGPLLQAVAVDQSPALGRLLQSVVTSVLTYADARGDRGYLWGEGAPDWLGVAASLTSQGLRVHAWLVRSLLISVQRGKGVRLTGQQREWVNTASRTLLEWAWSDQRLLGMVPIALSGACRSIAAAPKETVAALEPVLASTAKAHRHEFLRPLAENLARLARYDATFALRVTQAAFTTDYDMDDRVDRGPRLLPMSFSKRDDMRMVRRSLTGALKRVFARMPVTGTRLAVAILNSAAGQERSKYSRRDVGTFEFVGQPARMIADYSSVWGDRSYAVHDEWFAARRALIEGLVRTARSKPGRLDALLRSFARRNRYAVGWAALLRAGREEPKALGVHVASLLGEPTVLRSEDTRMDAGRLITAVWSQLPDPERLRVEQCILGLATGDADEDSRWQALRRDRLLGCIPIDQAVSTEARNRLAELAAGGGPPENRPPFESSGVRSISHEEFLRGRGVPVDEPQNQEMRAAIGKVRGFKPADNSRRLTAEQVAQFWPTFEECAALFASATTRGVHESFVEEANSAILECAQRIADAEDLKSSDPWVAEMRRRLLEASTDVSPEPSAEEDSRWDKNGPMWGSGLGRIEAAEGLMGLARRQATCGPEILAAVERLAADPHPAVRYQVLVRLLWLWETAPSLMWRLIEQTATREPRISICRFFAQSVLLHLPHAEVTRTDSLFAALYRRLTDQDEEGVSGSYATHVLRRALWDRHAPSESAIQAFVAQPSEHVAELRQLVSHARGLMVYRDEGNAVRDAASVRQWAFEFLRSVLNPLIRDVRAELDRHRGSPPVAWTETETGQLRTLYALADHVANQVYFASGAFNEKRSGNADEADCTRDPAEVARFFLESRTLLADLAQVEFINIAHDVLKTLEFLIPQDPAEVFRLIHRSIMAAQRDDLQYESMAADLVVGIIEQYLAEHRGLLAQNADLRRGLLDILDVFASTGWPKAIRLINRLDEAIR